MDDVCKNFSKFVAKVSDVRLPTHLVPEHYRLQLIPFLGNGTLHGHVEIDVACVTDSDNVTLHASDMTVIRSSIAVLQASTIVSLAYDQQREFFIIRLQVTCLIMNANKIFPRNVITYFWKIGVNEKPSFSRA